MRYPIVATDFDDTLLRSDLTLSPYTLDVIKRYEKAGGTLIVSTGRMYRSIYNSSLRVGLKKGLVISYQGGQINDMTDHSTVFSRTLNPEDAALLLKRLEEEKEASLQVYINDTLFVAKKTPRTLDYEKQCEIKAVETGIKLSEYISGNKLRVSKILAIAEPERTRQLIEEFRRDFDGYADICLSKPHFFECVPKGVSKGKAVEYICRQKGLTSADVITFGDGDNDISMLEFADLSFAVENACEGAKKAAKQICPSNDEDGVAKTIEKYCL